MTTAELEKRVRALEKEVKQLREARPRISVARPVFKSSRIPKKKKRPRWLQASLKDVEEGRVSGPFKTIEELRASLESDDK